MKTTALELALLAAAGVVDWQQGRAPHQNLTACGLALAAALYALLLQRIRFRKAIKRTKRG